MKIVSNRFLLSAFGALLATASLAHANMNNLRVTIPFDFVVGEQKLPAGDYSIGQSGTGGILVLHGVNHSTIVMSEPTSATNNDAPSLTFERHNGEVYLVKVQEPSGPGHTLHMKNK